MFFMAISRVFICRKLNFSAIFLCGRHLKQHVSLQMTATEEDGRKFKLLTNYDPADSP